MQEIRKSNKRVIVSVIMALMLIASMMPGMAFAAEGDATSGSITGTISASDTVYIGAPETMDELTFTANGNAHIDWSVTNGTGAATISKHNGQLVGSSEGTVTVVATLVSGVKTGGDGTGTGTGNTPCEGTTLDTASKTVTIAPSNEYGYQGLNGNTLYLSKAMGNDVTVVNTGTSSLDNYTKYDNRILGNVQASEGYINFGYAMSAGMNNFKSTTFDTYKDEIGIYSADGSQRLANVELAVDNATVIATGLVTIEADVSELESGDYILRFGPSVCGNNASKNLGCYIDCTFSLVN